MKTLTLIQGSPEWMQHRAQAFNASDAPAMLGLSKYKTRNQLLKERATGIVEEVDDATQRRFNDGHRFEALARTLGEAIIGEDLSPVTGADGAFSASFDGITFDHAEIFEHKTLNNDIRKAMGANGNTGGLDEMYRVQMEHQLMVSRAKKCLFMASTWDGENCAEEVHGWYLPDLVLRERIIAGWAQFAKDLETYVPQAEEVKAVADAIIGLPSLAVQIKGEVTTSNLPVFVSAADKFLAGIKTVLETDQDFANAEANVKACKAAEDGIEQTKKAITAQAVSIDEVMRTMDLYKEKLANVRLKLNKLVESEKLKRKELIIGAARDSMQLHITELQKELSVRLIVPVPDFALEMKRLKKLSAMQEAVDTALRNGKFEADTIAKDLRDKLAWLVINGESLPLLFQDLQHIIYKPIDDFKLVVTSRVSEYKISQAKQVEAVRAKMQAEEEAKAREKVEAEQRLKLENEIKEEAETLKKYEKTENLGESIPVVKQSLTTEPAKVVGIRKPSRPAHDELIQFVANNFNVSFDQACTWVIETAESLKVAA